MVGAGSARDGDVGALAHVEAVGVVTAIVVAVGVVNRRVLDLQTLRVVDAVHLDGRVLDVEALDDRRALELVSVEELGLVDTAVRALAVPPAAAVTVDDMAVRARDLDVGTGNTDQRAIPLLVTERGRAVEDDLRCYQPLSSLSSSILTYVSAILHVREVERLTSRDCDIGQDDGGARALRGAGRRGTVGTGEGARVGPLLHLGRRRSRRDHRRSNWVGQNG